MRNFSFGDEIIESDGKLNFYVQTEFDVDAAFGTFVLTGKNDDWLNIYANYDIAEDRPCDTLELTPVSYTHLHGGSASVDELNALDGKGTARQLIESGSGTVTPYGVVYDNRCV